MTDHASAEDTLIAAVTLAGWRIEDFRGNAPGPRYRLRCPEGWTSTTFYSTRYTAALDAKRELDDDVSPPEENVLGYKVPRWKRKEII